MTKLYIFNIILCITALTSIAPNHAMMDFKLEFYTADDSCTKDISTTDIPVDTDTIKG